MSMAESQETKIRRGQAFNLAIHDAIANDQECNPQYIYRRFVFYYSLGDALQGSDMDMIQEVIDNKDFDKVMKDLRGVLQ